MHPAISYRLATARAAELRSQARRDALARAARPARTHKPGHAAPRLGMILTEIADPKGCARRGHTRRNLPVRSISGQIHRGPDRCQSG